MATSCYFRMALGVASTSSSGGVGTGIMKDGLFISVLMISVKTGRLTWGMGSMPLVEYVMFKNMKNQPNKATVKDGLPTAEQIIREKIKEHSASTVNIDVDNIPAFTHFLFVAIDAMQSYSGQQNAELMSEIERWKALYELGKKSIRELIKTNEKLESVESENTELRERVSALTHQRDFYRKKLNEAQGVSIAKDLGIPDDFEMAPIVQSDTDELRERVKELEGPMQEFVDRVDRGEMRSKRTYAKFKEALKK